MSQAKSDGKSLAWLSGLKRLLGAQSEIPYEKSSSKKVPDLKEMVMEQEWSVTILAVLV